MDLRELSLKDRALIEALAEIAQTECMSRSWAEIEPMLASCWKASYGKESPLHWDEIAPFIQTACARTH